MEWPSGAPKALVPLGNFPAECEAEDHFKVLSRLTVPKLKNKPDGPRRPVGVYQCRHAVCNKLFANVQATMLRHHYTGKNKSEVLMPTQTSGAYRDFCGR